MSEKGGHQPQSESINQRGTNYILIVAVKLVNNIPNIESISIQNGRLNEARLHSQNPPVFGQNKKSSLVFYNPSHKVIFETTFDYPLVKTIPMRLPGSEDNFSPDIIYIEEPEVFLVLPYFKDIEFIEVYNPYNSVPATRKRFNEIKVFKEIYKEAFLTIPEPTPAEISKFHILIIASGFNAGNMGDFINKAETIKNFLLSKEPFKFYSSNISVHIYDNLADLECDSGCNGINRLLCCNSSKVISAAASSGNLYDEIIVIHNTTTYSGGGYRDYSDGYKFNSYNSYSMIYSGDLSDVMALHEFGHSFGNLCDEYSYTSEGYIYSPCVNCRDTCNIWSSITSACQQGCSAEENYYRPEDSIMISFDYPDFNSVSLYSTYSPDGLFKRLQFFTDYGYTNLPPKFDSFIGTIDGREGTLISFKASASDPEEDAITYSSENLPPGATFDKNTASFSWTPSYTDAGTYNFKLKASDGQLTSSQQVLLQVKNVKKVKK